MNIPEYIFQLVMLYNSHPVADILKQNFITLRILKCKAERTHGCPYDRGCSDAYYGREPNQKMAIIYYPFPY